MRLFLKWIEWLMRFAEIGDTPGRQEFVQIYQTVRIVS